MDKFVLALVIIGALNWGCIGIFGLDIVGVLFGGQGAVSAGSSSPSSVLPDCGRFGFFPNCPAPNRPASRLSNSNSAVFSPRRGKKRDRNVPVSFCCISYFSAFASSTRRLVSSAITSSSLVGITRTRTRA